MPDDELSDLWEHATIVFDTNALLNLFRYPVETRDDFLDLLERVKSRLWIPHHVGAEFQRRRLDIPRQQNEALKNFGKKIEQTKKDLKSSLNGFQQYMPSKSHELNGFIDSQLNSLREEVKKKFQDYKDHVLGDEAHEGTFQKITDLYDGRVGEPYSSKRLLEILNEGEQRYNLQIPPGYEDAGKSGNKYGDLIVWYQVLDHVEETKSPMFFVTDDEKEDWWTKVNTRPFAARQELVDEFLSHSSGKPIKFYLPQDFLGDARQRGMGVRQETVEEVNTFADEQRKADQQLKYQRFSNTNVQSGIARALSQMETAPNFQSAIDYISGRQNFSILQDALANSGVYSNLDFTNFSGARAAAETLEAILKTDLVPFQSNNLNDDDEDAYEDGDDEASIGETSSN